MTLPTPTSLYLFDGTGQDTMGTNDLTYNNKDNDGTDFATGILDYAANLNGVDKYLQAANNTVFDVTTGDFSVWGYFYRTSDSGGFETICAKFTAGEVGYLIDITSGDKLRFFCKDGTDGAFPETSTSIAVNTWYFFTCVADRDGSATIHLYNLSTGAYETASSAMSAVDSITNTNTFTVGRASSGSASFFPGRIDHLNVLMGTAITSTQVSDLVNTSRIGIHKRDSTDDTSITYFEARNFNAISIRGQNPADVIADIVASEKDAILIKMTGPTMQLSADWVITNEDSTVVYDDTNGSVTNAISIYKYLYDTLWATGTTQITAEHTLTFYNGNDKSFVRTGTITGIDVVQSADQPLTYRCTLQFQVGTV